MVDNISIMAHHDAELEGGGDHLIGLSVEVLIRLLALMNCAHVPLISYTASKAQACLRLEHVGLTDQHHVLLQSLQVGFNSSFFVLLQFLSCRIRRWP